MSLNQKYDLICPHKHLLQAPHSGLGVCGDCDCALAPEIERQEHRPQQYPISQPQQKQQQ